MYAWPWLTMLVGSVLAIAQSDVKRMLAYSSIAHAGFILVGVSASSQAGISGAMFYLVAYAAMILGAFGIVMLVSGRGEERTGLSAYAGLAERSPALAALLALFLLSLAGHPAHRGVHRQGLGVQRRHPGRATGRSPCVAVLASVVAAFFYHAGDRAHVHGAARGVGRAHHHRPRRGSPWPRSRSLTLLLGVFPSLLFDDPGDRVGPPTVNAAGTIAP